VLRLLRAGYLHVYIESPPPGMKNWLIYRVTEQADLVPQSSPAFALPTVACTRSGHNATGMKLLSLPQAHKLTEIWIAYSANLWGAKLQRRNAAKPKVMQKISLAGGSPNTFAPTETNLKGKVLEAALTRLRINGASEHDYPFNSVATQITDLVDNLTRAAACHPKTKGKELAVVLRDPVGVATELNALRMHRHALAEAEMAKPENAHPMTSLHMLDGLRRSVMDTNEARKMEAISPVMNQGAFQDIMRVRPNPRGWPDGTTWVRMTSRDDMLAHGPGMGRVVFPDHEERAAEWVQRQTAATFERYRKYIDEARIESWKADFDKKMRAEHSEPLLRYEADWWGLRKDASFNEYFAKHFDETDENGPQQAHSPGACYASEVHYALTPQPFVEGPVQEEYAAECERDPNDAKAVMQRALVGNQGDMLRFLQDYITNQHQEKLHDLSAGALLEWLRSWTSTRSSTAGCCTAPTDSQRSASPSRCRPRVG
jgi:hypothetical protein